jgi:hypothetical protein
MVHDENNWIACVGKFMCVVPPKTLRVDSSGQASRDAATRGDLQEALAALEFQSSSQTVDGGGVAISVGPAIQAFTDNEIIVSFCGYLTNVDYLAWRLFSPEGRRGEKITQSPLEVQVNLSGADVTKPSLSATCTKLLEPNHFPSSEGSFHLFALILVQFACLPLVIHQGHIRSCMVEM